MQNINSNFTLSGIKLCYGTGLKDKLKTVKMTLLGFFFKRKWRTRGKQNRLNDWHYEYGVCKTKRNKNINIIYLNQFFQQKMKIE